MSTADAREKLKGARRALYREAILDAAERIFAEAGYDAARIAGLRESDVIG